MRDITLVMAYYDNPQMLEWQLDNLRDMPEDVKAHLRVNLIDDCSPRWPAVVRDVGVPISLWRMKVDVRWNQDACRNIGMNYCETAWALLTDMDHLVTAETWQHLMNPANFFKTNHLYGFRRVKAPGMEEYKPHPNSWFMSADLFRRTWYDERFAGYYGTDGDFKLRCLKHARFEQLKAQLITVPREVVPDASTTTYTRKEHADYENIKRIRWLRSRDGLDHKPKTLSFPYERIQ